jgi:hypothetical protein
MKSSPQSSAVSALAREAFGPALGCCLLVIVVRSAFVIRIRHTVTKLKRRYSNAVTGRRNALLRRRTVARIDQATWIVVVTRYYVVGP